MRAVGNREGERVLREVALRRPAEVRVGHEAFREKASSSLASSVAQSRQLLEEAGKFTSGGACSSSRGRRPPPGAQGTGAGAAASTSAAGRQRPSARSLLAALEAPTPLPTPRVRGGGGAAVATSDEAPTSRVISVLDFQRGRTAVEPAPTLPYAKPEGFSPGRRRRAEASAAAAGRGLGAPSAGAPLLRSLPAVEPANGRTSLLNGVELELGNFLTTPAAGCSSFDFLLDRLIEHPEECMALRPWNWNP